MKHIIERMLIKNGASMVGFAKLEGLYDKMDLDEESSEDSIREPFEIPQYPMGISIALAYPRAVIKGINQVPTMEYHDAYHELNNQLDDLANMCAEYLEEQGYNAYPQTISSIKEFGVFRTVMPHKTVAVHAGLGWIGKSALFVTEQYGSALRLTSVLTDAPLKHKGAILQSRCGDCMLCMNACPGKAISGREWNPQLDRDEFFNAMDCRKKAREISATILNKEITLCGKCIEVCPYTQRYIKGAEISNKG